MAAIVQRTNEIAVGVRRLGFGVSGPHGSWLVSRRDTAAMIRHAFELGVRLFDVAPSYGNGEAERRLGEALQMLPRYDCIVSTKAGIAASGVNGRTRDFSPDAIRRSLDESMQRLRQPRIDWLILHGPAQHELTDELLQTLESFKADGLVCSLGVCGRGAEVGAALDARIFSVFMAPVHAGLPPADLARLGRIRSAGAEVVGFETLMPALRSPSPFTRGGAWRLARSLASKPQQAQRAMLRMSAPEALRWALGQGGASRALISTTRLGALEELVRAAESAPQAT